MPRSPQYFRYRYVLDMWTRHLVWVRRVAAVLIFLVAIATAFAGGLLTPYLPAAKTANIFLRTISAMIAF